MPEQTINVGTYLVEKIAFNEPMEFMRKLHSIDVELTKEQAEEIKRHIIKELASNIPGTIRFTITGRFTGRY